MGLRSCNTYDSIDHYKKIKEKCELIKRLLTDAQKNFHEKGTSYLSFVREKYLSDRIAIELYFKSLHLDVDSISKILPYILIVINNDMEQILYKAGKIADEEVLNAGKNAAADAKEIINLVGKV